MIENFKLSAKGGSASGGKIAIFYDWLNQWGGAERVLLDILSLYPEADLYTLTYDSKKTSWLPTKNIVFSQNLPNKIFYTPFYAGKLEHLDFSSYDILISTTSTVGHCFLTQPRTLFLCYFHNINRYLYQNPPHILKPLLKKYQSIDRIYAERPDFLFCNSKTVQNRISSQYQRPATIIYPGIDLDKFTPILKPTNDYFLIVSRLVPHKNIDLVIKAFENMTLKLKIVGTGREEQYLRCLASDNKNIEFLGNIDDSELIKLYQNCQGLIHPQEEDFGLSPLEAQACGRGVVAYNRGGATETVVHHQSGILFENQDICTLRQALISFLESPPKPDSCRLQAEKFDRQLFMLNFKKQVQNLWQKHCQTITQ
ncbi:glycosyltransferase [Candidatus Shapirobacteria bacterium]|nr:glycosyltransferase [Candidatus Shapirobacteria bacterium]